MRRWVGPKTPGSTVFTAEEEAVVVAFRKHMLLPLDDCLYALQATIPHLMRIPMKPATDSDLMPASHSDFIPAGVPI